MAGSDGNLQTLLQIAGNMTSVLVGRARHQVQDCHVCGLVVVACLG